MVEKYKEFLAELVRRGTSDDYPSAIEVLVWAVEQADELLSEGDGDE